MADKGQCEHSGCMCSVSEDNSYCSDHCRDAAAADIAEIACDCGHPGCA